MRRELVPTAALLLLRRDVCRGQCCWENRLEPCVGPACLNGSHGCLVPICEAVGIARLRANPSSQRAPGLGPARNRRGEFVPGVPWLAGDPNWLFVPPVVFALAIPSPPPFQLGPQHPGGWDRGRAGAGRASPQ